MDASVLVVDDERSVLKSIRRQLVNEPYALHLAEGGAEGLALLRREAISLIVSDMRMPEMDGVTFLRQAATIQPRSVRMVLSGYAEVGSILEAVNQGHVWRYITKPWRPEELKLAIRNGLDLWRSEGERRRLLATLKEKNQRLAELNEGLEAAVAARTQELAERSAILQMILEDADVEAVLACGLAAVERLAGVEAVALRVAHEGRTVGVSPPPEAEALAERCRVSGRVEREGPWWALPLAKGGVHLGELLLPRPEEESVRTAIRGMAALLSMELQQRRLLARGPDLVGDIDKLLGEIGG